ncbi:Flp pilus assembly protein CpaB [Jatrophihabitans sp. GAS493]|uniref:SAF domain-containing protein n=1 Tax=Jatrophihabitans sp. GAS493 TaxID=1907575 RepID=UPI000BB8664F|nr:SAF domain-containing protein [Jatrophihabitans sp. GAS493]SOD72505.1 Flp pilus assembly protein CpaB [Jatrophihabitans sp. GAS493]
MTYSSRPPSGAPITGIRSSRSRLAPFLRRCAPWIRRSLALGCLLLAVLATVNSHPRPAAAPQTTVLLASHPLSAGSYLAAADLKRASWPADDRPANALTAPGQAVGQRLATDLAPGELITRSRLVGRDLIRGLADGLSAAVVSLGAGGATALLHAGDHVDLLRADAASAIDGLTATDDRASDSPGSRSVGAQVIGDDVLVLAVLPDPASVAGGALAGSTAVTFGGGAGAQSGYTGSSSSDNTQIIVAVDRTTALRLASSTGSGVFATVRNHQ